MQTRNNTFYFVKSATQFYSLFKKETNELDRRTAYTRMIIKEAFLNLLSNKNLEEITIKELCLEANINRATFYRNFDDIYDLFEQIEKELMAEAFPNGTEFYDISQLLEVMYHNQVFYREFFNNHLESSFIKNTTNEMKIIFANALKEKQLYDNESYNFRFHFAIHGATGLLKEWLSDGCPSPPKEFSILLLKTCYTLFDM